MEKIAIIGKKLKINGNTFTQVTTTDGRVFCVKKENIDLKNMTFKIASLENKGKKEFVKKEQPTFNIAPFLAKETEKANCLEFTVEFVHSNFAKKVSIWLPKSWSLNLKIIKNKLSEKIQEMGWEKYGEALIHGIDL